MSERRLHTLLVDLEHPTNIGNIIRTHYVLNEKGTLYIHDSRKILETQQEEIQRFSSNTYSLQEFTKIEDLVTFLHSYNKRKIATAITQAAIPLPEFTFQPDDLIIFGNEHSGIHEEVIALCDQSLIIPMPGKPLPPFETDRVKKNNGKHSSLNVATSYGIISYAGLIQQ